MVYHHDIIKINNLRKEVEQKSVHGLFKFTFPIMIVPIIYILGHVFDGFVIIT